MTDFTPCPKCGTPVPTGGLCPRCLLGAGLGEGGPDDAALPPSPEEIGKEFPAFEILEVLGQGGMGIVYKARQKNLDRLVALKVLPPEIAREAGFADRFTREARTLARLHHEHIVGIHEFGETNGLYYLVMEFVDGPNLRQVIREGKLEAPQALAIVPQICEALQYAHDQGVVHRDIKPENVLLDRAGHVKIADFGLAKLAQRAPMDFTLTRAGQVMGTLQYMAPEQYREPDSVDHRADIYSLGVVFYEMLTGELPVGTFPPPSARAGVDARLDGVVLRALERERDRRWQKASEMGTRIDTIASGVDFVPAAAAAPASPPLGQPGPNSPTSSVPASTLAIAGVLGMPAAAAAGLLASVISVTAAVIFGGIVLAAGWVMSIVAWERVRGSHGGLRGLPAAVLGALLPPLMVLGVLAAHLPLRAFATRTAVVLDAPSPGDTREIAASAARVVGGPPRMSDESKARLVVEVEEMWPKIPRLVQNEPNPAVRATALAPSERKRLEAMAPAERKAAGDGDYLGVLYPPPSSFHFPPHLAWVVLDGEGTHARVVRTGTGLDGTVAFPILFEDGAWHPALGAVESKAETLEEGDRSGWISSRWYGEGRDPAERVTGGPASLTPADRNLLARQISELWSTDMRVILLGALGPSNASSNPAKLYHVALDAAGKSGRMVVSNGKVTIAVGVTMDEGEDWQIIDKDTESRVGGAVPDDRSGHLARQGADPAKPSGTVPSELENLSVKVAGGPPGLTTAAKARIVVRIEELWTRLLQLVETEPNPYAKSLAYSPSERSRLAAMAPAERNKADAWNRLGILFQKPFGAELSEFHLAWVALDGEGKQARVVRSTAVDTLAFPVLLEEDAWYPALGPVEIEERPLEDGDRGGWIDKHWYGDGEDPARRVTGGPTSLSDADRHEIAKDLIGLWWSYDSIHVYQDVLHAGDASGRIDLRLFHAALDSSGTTARLVVSSGDPTIAVSVKRETTGDPWQLVDKDAELRKGPPDPRDRDGHLHR